METQRTIAGLRGAASRWWREGLRVALVPTMGALHEGHLSLVRLARAHGDRVIVSIFVNPRQFAPQEDLAAYPRQERRDADLLAAVGCDLLFAPPPEEVYPPGFATEVTVSGVTADLEGAARPRFFAGVATVVTKLLLQALPDVAVFGEKDYQQLLTIRKLARDLDIPVDILAGPTVREADGLALSSRNAYLSPEERRTAVRMSEALNAAVAELRAGAAVEVVEARASATIAAAGFGPVDYVSVRDAEDLSPPTICREGRPTRILAAAWLGRTRLIDNLPI